MITAIVQARNGSTRLPGKVMKELNGMPMLLQQIKRMKMSKLVDKLVIATTVKDIDNPIAQLCVKEGIAF